MGSRLLSWRGPSYVSDQPPARFSNLRENYHACFKMIVYSRANLVAIVATCLPQKRAIASSLSLGQRLPSPVAMIEAPYTILPLTAVTSLNALLVYGPPTITSPRCSSVKYVEAIVVSCPPCCMAVLVKTLAALPTSAFDGHIPV